MAKLPNARPVGELDALLASAKPQCRIVVTLIRRDTVCGPPVALVAELGRAKRRGELEAKIDGASAELARTQPPKVANSDAKALTRYLGALGLEVGPDRLNDLLVLLAVIMIEAGGGLSLAIGMALGAPPAARPDGRLDTSTVRPEQSRTLPMNALDALPDTASASSVSERPASVVRTTGLVAWLQLQGGRSETSMRRLASAIGRSPSGVHEELRRLVAAGLRRRARWSRWRSYRCRPEIVSPGHVCGENRLRRSCPKA